jgi:hypothetical protein
MSQNLVIPGDQSLAVILAEQSNGHFREEPESEPESEPALQVVVLGVHGQVDDPGPAPLPDGEFLHQLDADPMRWKRLFVQFLRKSGGTMTSHSPRSALMALMQIERESGMTGLYNWAEAIYSHDRSDFTKSMMG